MERKGRKGGEVWVVGWGGERKQTQTGFNANNAHGAVCQSACAVLSSGQFGVSAAGRASDVVCGDALFAELHVHGCCGSVGLHTEPLGGCDWTGHRLGLTDVCPTGNVLGRRSI